MKDIKPIETEYRGYRFRSRLEARWAIFFDALGIEYIYESEGYKCTDINQLLALCGKDGKDLTDEEIESCKTIFYLPDFFLPQFGIHVEVKGCDEALRQDEYKLHCALETGGPLDSGLLILGNIPDPLTMSYGNIPVFSFLYPHEGSICHKYCAFVKGYKGFDLAFGKDIWWNLFWFSGEESQSDYWGDNELPEETSTKAKESWFGCTHSWASPRSKSFLTLKNAYEQARSARFEHGEKGGHS